MTNEIENFLLILPKVLKKTIVFSFFAICICIQKQQYLQRFREKKTKNTNINMNNIL